MKYKFIEHTADIQFQSFGKTLEKLFENSMIAVIESICKDKIKSNKSFKIKVKGKDFESLLYNFLEELLILFDSKHFIPSRKIKIEIDDKKFELVGEVFGDDAKNYEIYSHIKAITYNQMFVKKEKNKWIAQVVLDV